MLFGAVGTLCGRSTFRPLARFLDVQHRDVDLGEVLLVQLLQPPLSLHLDDDADEARMLRP
ncbi:MAG: hypothetical protein HW413_1584 [Thermoleophilia bacterium]|nr:hypothetical protein [Thermoleophilia bacterium]